MFSSFSKPVDSARLQEMIPNSGKHSGNPTAEGRADVSNGNAKVPLELPVLVSLRVVPQLREMAQRLVAAGYHAQCLKIYRYPGWSTYFTWVGCVFGQPISGLKPR